jgi:hypothetical protein
VWASDRNGLLTFVMGHAHAGPILVCFGLAQLAGIDVISGEIKTLIIEFDHLLGSQQLALEGPRDLPLFL